MCVRVYISDEAFEISEQDRSRRRQATRRGTEGTHTRPILREGDRNVQALGVLREAVSAPQSPLVREMQGDL